MKLLLWDEAIFAQHFHLNHRHTRQVVDLQIKTVMFTKNLMIRILIFVYIVEKISREHYFCKVSTRFTRTSCNFNLSSLNAACRDCLHLPSSTLAGDRVRRLFGLDWKQAAVATEDKPNTQVSCILFPRRQKRFVLSGVQLFHLTSCVNTQRNVSPQVS